MSHFSATACRIAKRAWKNYFFERRSLLRTSSFCWVAKAGATRPARECSLHRPRSDGHHNRLNCSASMVMNINRSSMADFGFSPPTRVFEVSGAGTCMLCDDWPGIDDCFEPGKEILVVRSAEDVVKALERYDLDDRTRIGEAFHARGLRDHTYEQRALQAEKAFLDCISRRDLSVPRTAEAELESA